MKTPNPSNHMITRIMRYMAWERAKGEMESMLTTYVGEDEEYKNFKAAMENFVEHIEDNGLQE